jgi:hypothetical protein
MARGDTLQQLVSDLRDELRRANTPSAGPTDTASLRRTINHVYDLVYASFDWPHLLRYFDKITLNAGQRYYDPPAGLDYERLQQAVVWWNGLPEPLARGISFDDYATYDPAADERTSPALKWDVRFTGSTEQIEIWPLPDSGAQSIQFAGIQKIERLVDDNDICRLDGEIIVLYAAAELLPKDSSDKTAKLQLVQERLRLARLRSGNGQDVRLGVKSIGGVARSSQAVVRVS